MHDVPEKNAAILAPVAPIVAAALRNVGGIAQWSRVRRLERLEAYYKGRQYDGRPYDWDGTLASSDPLENPIGIPVPAEHYVPVAQRRPPVNYRLGRKIVQARTDLVFTGGDPEISVDGDQDTRDWLQAAAKVGQLWRRMKAARNLTGGMSESFLVHGIRAGRPFVEVLEACDVHVLAWADQDDRVPAHVLRVWKSNELEINPTDQTLEEVRRWYAQEWFVPLTPDDLAELDAAALAGTDTAPRGTERLLRYLPKDAAGPNRWELVTEVPLWEMPVIPMTNVDSDDGASEGDFEGLEGLIDEANAVLCATSGGTKRNVDPTLIVKEDPIKNPGEIGKGGTNTIWSEGGAEYLQLQSDGVKAGIDTFDRLKALGLDQASVTEFDPEKMSGAAQSGEALRRLLQPFIAIADSIRAFSVAPVAVKILRGWWRAALRIERRQAVEVTVIDPSGASSTVLRKDVVRLPPKIETDDDGETTGEKEERVPGEGGDVSIVWPDYVSLTSQDKLQLVQLLAQLVGGKPLATLRTVVAALKASKIVQIDDVEEEVEGLLVDQERNAAAQAATLGDVAPFGKGRTPPPKGGKAPPSSSSSSSSKEGPEDD